LFNNVIFGTLTGPIVYYGSVLAALSALRLGGSIFNISFASLDLLMKLGFDEPSADWELLCDDCEEVSYTDIWLIGASVKDLTTEIVTSLGSTGYEDWKPFTVRNGRAYEVTSPSNLSALSISGTSTGINASGPIIATWVSSANPSLGPAPATTTITAFYYGGGYGNHNYGDVITAEQINCWQSVDGSSGIFRVTGRP
jgi:hypothetical protein